MEKESSFEEKKQADCVSAVAVVRKAESEMLQARFALAELQQRILDQAPIPLNNRWAASFLDTEKEFLCFKATLKSFRDDNCPPAVDVWLTVDTECTHALLLPDVLRAALGISQRLDDKSRKATTGAGPVIVVQYMPVKVVVPLLRRSNCSCSNHSEDKIQNSLDVFSVVHEKEEEEEGHSLEGKEQQQQEQEAQEERNEEEKGEEEDDVLEIDFVPLQRLTRQLLEENNNNKTKNNNKNVYNGVVVIGSKGLQQLSLALAPSLPALLPLQKPPFRLGFGFLARQKPPDPLRF